MLLSKKRTNLSLNSWTTARLYKISDTHLPNARSYAEDSQIYLSSLFLHVIFFYSGAPAAPMVAKRSSIPILETEGNL